MFEQLLREILFVIFLGSPFILLERFFAAHRTSYREQVPRDLGALGVGALLSIPAGAASSILFSLLPLGAAIERVPLLPWWVTFPIAALGSDCALYWAHRTIHTRPLWRVHRWHHCPKNLYWLAGVRTSLLQLVLYSPIPLLFILLRVPADFLAGWIVLGQFQNHCMHANVKFKSRWLEMIFVTPRMHHIHHSKDPRHYGSNFGAVFSFWDRLFGTYFNPDQVTAPLVFGINEVVSGPRIVIGV
jgi:sterol desaturase/sphingolipid hydroxylase (fatty acid hydroxylase superfamily)